MSSPRLGGPGARFANPVPERRCESPEATVQPRTELGSRDSRTCPAFNSQFPRLGLGELGVCGGWQAQLLSQRRAKTLQLKGPGWASSGSSTLWFLSHPGGHCSHLSRGRAQNVLTVPDCRWHTSLSPTFQNLLVCRGGWEVTSSQTAMCPTTFPAAPTVLLTPLISPCPSYLRPLHVPFPLPEMLCLLLAWFILLPSPSLASL